MRSALRTAIFALYAAALVLPVAVFLNVRGGFSAFSGLAATDFFQSVFPLFGLIAFTLVTMQVLIATNRWWLITLWPRVILFHRFQGSFALLFALTHPLFILL